MNKHNTQTKITGKIWHRPPHRIDLILTDFGLLNFSFLLAAVYLYQGMNLEKLVIDHLPLAIFVNIAWLALALHYSAYRWYERVRVETQLGRILRIIVLHFALITLFYYQVLYHAPMGSFLWVAYGFAVLLLISGRVVHHLRLQAIAVSFRYIIVGGQMGNIAALKEAFEHSFAGKAKMIGRFGRTQHPGVRNIGSYSDLIPYLKGHPPIDKLILFYFKLSAEEKNTVLRLCNEQFIDLEIAPRETNIFPRGYRSHQHGDLIILTLKEEPLVRLHNKVMKRVFDIVFSLLVIVFLLSWLIPVIGLIIKRKSPGPVFFLQDRSGFANKVFRILKFRTMHVNAESDTVQATVNDERVFKFGEFMRKNSIDELPQFLNVLRGQMSVVGPRPHMLKHTDKYTRLIESYMIRHKVKPGVTGWAQVNGYRGPTDKLWKMKKRVEYDVRYLENWSLPLDARCIIYTVVNGIKGDENAV